MPLIVDPGPTIADVRNTVHDGFTTAGVYADSATQTAMGFLEQLRALATLAAAIPSVDATLTPVASAVTAYVAPDAPVEPDGMTFGDIQAPTAPALPTVSALTVPSMPSAPDTAFEFSESGYTTALLTSFRTLLADWIEGAATGIDPTVEAQIWQRGRDREVQTRLAAEDEAMNLFAARGFRKPPGVLSLELQRAAQAAQTQDISSSREISVQQAQLEQGNRHKAIDAAVATEGQLITYEAAVKQRTFEAARFARQLIVDVFRARVDGVRTEVEAAAKGKEFEIKTVVELPLEIYKGEVDAYKSRIDAETGRVTGLSKIYETRGRVFEAMSKGEADRVDAEVRVYAALINQSVEEARLRLQAASQNGQILAQKYQALIEALRAGGTIAAQVAAGALSAVHLSASVTASGSLGMNYGLSDAHHYEELKQPSVSTTISTGTETRYNYNGTI